MITTDSIKKTVSVSLTTPAVTSGAGVFILFVIFFWNSISDWISLWNTDRTYSHGILIPFLSLYLIWLKKDRLLRSPLKPAYLLLIALSLTLALWLLASITDTKTIELTLLPFIFIFAYTSIIGYKSSFIILAPLLFLLLATPIWSVLTPLLQTMAVFSNETALKLTGIPTYIAGTKISIPAGNFNIEGGCSGLKYLVATLALGAFYAISTFNKLKPVLIILGLCITFSIVLNWIRIYIIILVGQYSDMQSSLIKDHDNFGWILYGVCLIPFFILVKKLTKDMTDEKTKSENSAQQENNKHLTYFSVIPVLLIISAALFSNYLQNREPLTLHEITTPQAAPPWIGPITENNWKPDYSGARIEKNLLYIGTEGKPDITLNIYHYGKQEQDNELINELNNIADPDKIKSQEIIQINNFQMIESLVFSPNKKLRLVLHWFHINERNTTKALAAKLLQAKDLLHGKASSSLISISVKCDTDCKQERKELKNFIKKHENHIFDSLKI